MFASKAVEKAPRRGRWLAGAVALAGLLTAAGLHAQETLQQALFDDRVARHWIYDDFSRAVQQAKATGKPILALLRCVP